MPGFQFRKRLRYISFLQHNGHQGGQYLAPEVFAHVCTTANIQLLLVNDKNLLGFELLDDFLLVEVVKLLLESHHNILYFIKDFLRVEAEHGFGLVVNIYQRSEEHTSELQSLMRISYAVFCLTKQNIIRTIHNKLI